MRRHWTSLRKLLTGTAGKLLTGTAGKLLTGTAGKLLTGTASRWRRVAAFSVAGLVVALLPVTAATAATDPCAAPVSVIACENSKPGTPESDWRINNSGDSTIQGFTTSMSVNVGETVTFKVKSTASSYHIDILRLGYYQGNGARKLVAGLRPSVSLPQSQPNCLTDASTGLIDCGNWAASASWAVPATAVSGLYEAHLVRDDTGGSSVIPFVVRNDGWHSDLLFQTSDTTWQAYNTYGGNSLYQCTAPLCPPGNPGGYKGAFKVSYNRPFHSAVDDGGRSWFLYAEYPMLRFLEANGYDVSYTSGADVASRGPLLLNHRAFLSVGHDEYWSGDQRANVEAARAAGVSLAFFSGNEVFWKTRWENGTDASHGPNRTLVTYKETHFDAPIDPQNPPTWTGTWRDPRFSPPADGGRPENALTGQFFIVNSGTTDIKVPAQYKGLRFWRNTPVANLSAGQSVTLGPGAGTLGYEWDEDADNGFRPAGLIQMSSTTNTAAQTFVDYGTNVQNGQTATHHLTLYRSGAALVFGAGTVQWSWGLDGDNPSGQPADRTMQQATVNLFADLGVQPFALITGLVAATASTDTTAPTATISAPAAGANLTDGARVTISGTAADTDGVVGVVEVSTDAGHTWHPATGTTNWSYSWIVHGNPTATLQARAADDSGNLSAPTSITVNVICPCNLWGPNVTPGTLDSGDTHAVELGVKFTTDTFGTISGIRYYKSSANTGTHVGNLWTAGGQLLARANFTSETSTGWQQVNFSAPVPITPGTTYIASYFAPVGHYAQDAGYFYPVPAPQPDGNDVVDSPPLHALRNSPTVSNGVYTYNGSTIFPTSTFNAENYWVDVVYSPAPPPGQATGVTATAGFASAALNWTAPSSGGPVTTYIVTPYIGGAAQSPVLVTGSPAPTNTVVTGLTNGTTYTFTVTATNPNGAGPVSDPSGPVTPSASASLVFNGGFENGLTSWTASGVVPPTASTVRAHSGTRSALLGTVSGTEPLGESTLTQTVGIPGTGTSTLSFWYWSASTDALCSGSGCVWDWTEMQIRSTAGATLATVLKVNSNAQAWTQVSYDLTPYAGQNVVLWCNVHQDGASPPDDTSVYLDDVSVTNSQPTPPAAPTNVTASPGNGSATVSWTAPSSGGSPITSYTITPYIGAAAQPPTTITGNPPATNTTIGGLTNGTTYTFTVTATNQLGTGPASAPSNPVTPSSTPPPTPAFVQQVTAHALNRSSLAVVPASAIVTGNRIIVEVGVWSGGNATAATVTDIAGNTYTKVLSFVASDATEQSIWTAPITAGGGTRPTITVTTTGTADIGIAALEYSGLSTAAGSAVVDQQAHASGTTGPAATVNSGATPPTTAGNELAIGFYNDSGFGSTPTAGTGWTARASITGASDMDMLVEDAIVAVGATPNAAAATRANTVWLMSTVVFKHA